MINILVHEWRCPLRHKSYIIIIIIAKYIPVVRKLHTYRTKLSSLMLRMHSGCGFTNSNSINRETFRVYYNLNMRYVAAYLLATLGGNANPKTFDIKNILGSVGI